MADPAVPGRIITLFQQAVKVVREQIFEELALVQSIDWLRPPQPRDYIPFTPDQIIFGVQHYVCVFDDGELRSYSFPHNLGTEAFHLTVRRNIGDGRLLVLGSDYTVKIPSANEVVLDFPLGTPPPAFNSLALVLNDQGRERCAQPCFRCAGAKAHIPTHARPSTPQHAARGKPRGRAARSARASRPNTPRGFSACARVVDSRAKSNRPQTPRPSPRGK